VIDITTFLAQCGCIVVSRPKRRPHSVQSQGVDVNGWYVSTYAKVSRACLGFRHSQT